MNKKVFIAILVILTLINVSAFGFWLYRKYAVSPPRRMVKHIPNRNFLQALGLTPEQAKKFRKSQRQFRLEADSLNRQLQIARLALMDEILRQQPDTEKIDSLLDVSKRFQGVLEKKLVNHLLAQKKYLTPEQQITLFRLMETRMKPKRGAWRRRQTDKPKINWR